MHMDGLSPASPPSFSFPRITRRRRRSTNTGGPPLPPLGPPHPLPQPVQAIIGFAPTPAPQVPPPPPMQPVTTPTLDQAASSAPPDPSTRTFRIRLVPHLENARSLHFDPIVRDVRFGGSPLRVGRFTDRQTNPPRGNGLNPNDRNSDKVAFRSKVVSRSHAELWVENQGKFYLKDTKSSSGTFINHMRLSPPGQESLPHLLKDGDVIQLGVDYQGGTEEMYRCVKIKVEVGQGREWQGGANAYNTAALKQLRTLQAGEGETEKGKAPLKKSVGDCCICLFAVTVCQSLFIAPCSHSFHYKCIRPMLELHHPGFSCPLCRTFADLEADVEVDAEQLEQEGNSIPDELIHLVSQQQLLNGDDPRVPGALTAEFPVSSNGVNARPAVLGPANEAINIDSDPEMHFEEGHTVPPTAMESTFSGTIRQARRPAPAATSSTNPFRNGMSSSRHSQAHPLVMDQDDAQVEDVLGGDFTGEEEDEPAINEHGVLFAGAFVNGPNGRSRSDTMHLDDTVGNSGAPPSAFPSGSRLGSNTGSLQGLNQTYNGNRTGPLRIDSGRRRLSMSDSDRDARDFAEAATPLNTTFIAMANSLLSAVEQYPSHEVPPLPTHHMVSSQSRGQSEANGNVDSDDQDVELELDDGTEAEENGRASSSGSNGMEGMVGEGGVAMATSSSGRTSGGVAGAKRKR